jgi:hypothetical protein
MLKGKMMKKILALVLVMAVSAMAGPVDFNVTSPDATTVEIAYTGSVVGMALDVDCDGTLQVTAISMPAFFDVFMDYAYEQGASYVYGEGTAAATQDAAGVATLPSASFTISAGGLEDDGADTVPASGVITLTVSGEGTLTVSENTLRGGVVDYDGAMTVSYTSDSATVQATAVCVGDVNGDSYVTVADVSAIITEINNNGDFLNRVAVNAGNAAMDVNEDNYVTVADVSNIITNINNNGDFLNRVACP